MSEWSPVPTGSDVGGLGQPGAGSGVVLAVPFMWGDHVGGRSAGACVTENIEPQSAPVNRIAPKRARVRVGELVLIVRPPGRPAAVRAFTSAEADEAFAYAASVGGVVDELL